MTTQNTTTSLTLSASFLEHMDKPLRNQLMQETLRQFEFDAFETLVPFADHSYGSFSYHDHYFDYLLAFAPLPVLQKHLPAFLQHNTHTIAVQNSFSGFLIAPAFYVLLCNAIDAKQNGTTVDSKRPTYEQHVEVIRFILQKDRQEHLFSWLTTPNSHSSFQSKNLKNTYSYYPEFEPSNYGTPSVLQLLYRLDEPSLYPLLKDHPRFSDLFKPSANNSNPLPFLMHDKYWHHNPTLSTLLLEQYTQHNLKTLSNADPASQRYSYQFSKTLCNHFLVNTNPIVRQGALPAILQLPLNLHIDAMDYSTKYRLLTEVHKTFNAQLPFSEQVCTQVHKALFVNPKNKRDNRHLMLETLGDKNPAICNNLMHLLQESYLHPSATNNDPSATDQPTSLAQDLVQTYSTKALVSKLFRLPSELWEPICDQLDYGLKLIGFLDDRAGLDPSFLMIAAEQPNPKCFAWAVDYLEKHQLLDHALSEKAWVFSQGSGRKKGDVLAFCIAQGLHEQAQYLLSKRPQIEQQSAKKVVQKMRTSASSPASLRAQSAFDQLALQQQFSVQTSEQPAPPTTSTVSKKRL